MQSGRTMESLPAIESLTKTTLRLRLREETAAIHQSLHHSPGLRQLTSADCTRADYINVLNIFFQFYHELDERFDFVPRAQRFSHEAKPLLWLEKDFLALNQVVPQRSFTFGFNLMGNMPSLCMETYIGYLYVKQGSTLGGQTISKHLKKSLALEPGVTQFFFTGFGDLTAHHWKEFLNYVSQHERYLDADLVVHSAQTYFGILDQLFSRYFPQRGINE